MGHSIFSFPRLFPPFKSIDERYIVFPKARDLVIGNDTRPAKLIYFLDGGFEVELPDGTRHLLDRGDAISHNTPWTLRYRAISPVGDVRMHILLIRFYSPPDVSRRRSPEGFQSHLDKLASEGFRQFRHYPKALERSGAMEIVKLLRKEAENISPSSRATVSGLAMALVNMLWEPTQRPSPRQKAPVAGGLAKVEHVRHHIQEHFREKLTLTDIAWRVQLSGEHLERLFKKHLGITVFGYLDQVRIEKARDLLITTELPVVRIASLCGFSSPNLLRRHFKARLGISPLACRDKWRKQESFTPSRFSSDLSGDPQALPRKNSA